MELRLAEAESIISTRDKEVTNLKIAPEQSKDKFYNMGFADVENSCEPIMFQTRRYGFEEGLLVAMAVLSVPEESPFRNPDQIPYPKPPPLVQNPAGANDEDTHSMRELM